MTQHHDDDRRHDDESRRANESRRRSDAAATVAKAYVHEMLDFNPMWDSPQIIRRRREIWGGEPIGVTTPSATTVAAASHDPDADARLRDRARQCLDKVQSEFYQLPDGKLRQYVRILRSNRLPEYAAVAARLQAAVDLRDTLRLVEKETGDVKFAYSLQQSVVRPAAEGAVLREQYIEAICDERRVRAACGTVKKYVTDHPEVYALERDWFDMLLDPVNQRSWSARYPSVHRTGRLTRGGSGMGGSGKWIVIIAMLVPGVVRLSSVISRDSKTHSAPYTAPAPTGGGDSDQRAFSDDQRQLHAAIQKWMNPPVDDLPPNDDAASPSRNPQSLVERLEQNHPYDELKNHEHRDQMIEKSRELQQEMVQRFRSRYPGLIEEERSNPSTPNPPSLTPMPGSGRYP